MLTVITFLIERRLFILRTKGSRQEWFHSGDTIINTIFKVNSAVYEAALIIMLNRKFKLLKYPTHIWPPV